MTWKILGETASPEARQPRSEEDQVILLDEALVSDPGQLEDSLARLEHAATLTDEHGRLRYPELAAELPELRRDVAQTIAERWPERP